MSYYTKFKMLEQDFGHLLSEVRSDNVRLSLFERRSVSRLKEMLEDLLVLDSQPLKK